MSETERHMDLLRWLHLSDLHCGQRGERTRWPTARGPFLQDLREQTAKLGPPDLILVSGDLAYSGQKREYERLKDICDEITAAVGGSPLWVVVPGNHDLRWPEPGDATAKGLRSYPDDAALRRAAHTAKSDTQRYLRRLFADFERFFRDRIISTWQSRPDELRLSYQLGSLPGDFLLQVEKNGLCLGIVGLNSAFLQLDGGDYERRLCIEPEQLPGDLPRFVEQTDAALLMMHHPPSWLSPRSRKLFEQDIYPPGRFVACHFGHMHQHRATTELGSSGEPRRYLQASSLFGLEHYGEQHEDRATGYCRYHLQRTSAQEGKLSWFPRAALFLDDGLLRLHDDPRATKTSISVPLRRREVSRPTALPSPPSRPTLTDRSALANPFAHHGRITDPSQFVGRKELLRQLFEDLRRGGNRALLGPAQIGKSSLLSVVCSLGPEQLGLPPDALLYVNLQLIDDDSDFFDVLCHKLGIAPSRGYKLERQLASRRVVLCLDEVEKLRSDRFPVEVREQLRGLADGADAPLSLLLASRVPLDQLFPDAPDRTSPLYNICPQLVVPPFSESECRELCALRLDGSGVHFSDSELSELVTVSQGHPATLLAAAAQLFDKYRGRP
ncbi:MAG: metallophosphoesterase [Myxococcales bacterium]|nr:metallophosphoesterase [Myxococcales bacterium]